ncbi:MAG: DUF2497 domain-containing protein [Hyphomicrobiales bacterium]|nr:DUF2497 domain-containing protein [Hyphomicrobiales bacterium]
MSSKAATKPETTDENEPSMEEILASIRKIIADDSLGTKKDEPTKKPAPAAKKAPEPPPAAEIDEDAEILDLAKVATVASTPQEVSVETVTPAIVPETVAMPKPEPELEPAPEPVTEMPAPVRSVAALEERIMSENTKALVSQAFQTLSRHTAMPAMGRSLEDVVVELLRPMLRDWIDSHLPAIVEKHVRAEIERVARGG